MTAVTHDHDAPYQPVFVGERRKELDGLFPLYPTTMACILPDSNIMHGHNCWSPKCWRLSGKPFSNVPVGIFFSA